LNSFRNILGLLLLFVCNIAFASHYRAGEITYEQISGRLYRVTAVTYTDPNSPANEFTSSIILSWGDLQTEEVQRAFPPEQLSNTVNKNTYIATHQYASDGNFLISLTDPNRVANILNINGGLNTDLVPFYVESLLNIDNSLAANTSPQLTVPPIIDGCLQFYYTHNPGAYDPDGDSLAYKIVPPKQGPKEDVPNYTQPESTDSFKLNPYTGTLYWVKPVQPGLYNIAIRVEEWRNGILIGYVVRDMQIRIKDCINDPPTAATVVNSCVEAGDSVKFNVTSTDINIQLVTIRGYGGPFDLPVSPAVLSPNPGQGVSLATTQFLWKTNCRHIRYRPHSGTIESQDNFSTPLANYSTFSIRVVGPAPKNLTTKQRGDGFVISWDKDTCAFANGYKIYRKIDSTNYTPPSCKVGLPESLGYTLIGEIKGKTFPLTDTFFYDNNNGEGLSPLINYCYRVVAIYPSRNDKGQPINDRSSESYPSIEVCDAIIRSSPVITLASVRFTSLVNGAIKLAWIRPDTLDTLVYKAPYQIICKRATITNGTVGTFTNIKTFDYTSFEGITDSMFIDTNINTVSNHNCYRLEFRYDSSGISTFINNSPLASSVFASVYSTDNANIISWTSKVPWINESYTLFRKNQTTSNFDSIITVSANSVADTGLINGVLYEYYVQSNGFYSFLDSPIINLSQRVSGTPIDTIKPCAPVLTVTQPCDNFTSFSNKLNWTSKPNCANDVLSYNVYYKKFADDEYTKIGTVDINTTSFIDDRDTLRFSIAGCYAVTGVDSFNNESNFENTFCVDNCPYYEIPNVFTPGSIDGKNDLLNPFPYRFIDHIELHIYDRWGLEVFQTKNLDINWDGKDLKNGIDCTEGTYFYTCDVFEQYLNELKNNKRRGTIKLNR
jgi:gliding motility-associated-like protein